MTLPWRLVPLLVLGGCTTVGPNFSPPSWSGPDSWFGGGKPRAPVSQTVEAPIDPNWWTLFRDPKLTDLEARVANENLDVRVAALRIDESRAQYDVAAAAGLPSINANASYTRQKASNVGVFANAPNALGASGTWSVFGRRRADSADPDWFYDPLTGRRAPDRRRIGCAHSRRPYQSIPSP